MSISGDQPGTLEIWDRARGRSITGTIVQGFVSWIIAAFTAGIAGLQDIATFLFLPFMIFVNVAQTSIEQFVLTPMGITDIGALVTAGSLDVFGLFALPVSVGVALFTLLLVAGFLMLGITSNVVPGLVVDNRVWAFLFSTPEEEAEGED